MELPGYKIHGELGVGGQARVYLATQESFDRKVAIKVLLPQYAEDQEFTERFLREAKTVAQLSHPHIISVYDFGQCDGHFYMVMEYLAGGDLEGRIADGLKDNEALEIISHLSMALHMAHEKGYVHRDVKPANVMFREDGSTVLTDFGIARLQSGANKVTMVGQVLGTPRYMSPEQLQGRNLDGRADIYSLGIILYEMLAKRVPYQHDDFTTLAMMHCKDPIPSLPTHHRRYQRLFERMVEKEAEKRFASGKELAATIQAVLSGKKDPETIDSSVSIALKRQARFKAGDPGADESAPKQHLPRKTSILLQELDPLLDSNWSSKVSILFKPLDGPQRTYAFSQYLRPKGIYYDKTARKFVFEGRASLNDIKFSITSTALQQITKKLIKAEEMLCGTRDAVAFADLMESSISIIDGFDVQENLVLQKEKGSIRQAFLDDLVLIVRNAAFEVPETHRKLTADEVKTFFIHVFLKQRMLGYRFRSTPLSSIERHPHSFIRNVVAKEARIRECDVIRTDKLWFLIGPVKDFSQNPFSARRFLHEDATFGNTVVYFNIVSIPLREIDDSAVRERTEWAISRVITLQRQLSADIIQLVKEMDKIRGTELLPMLQKSIDADGTDVESAVTQRLLEYEQTITVHILAKIPKALTELAQSQDDYEYLFYNLRQFIIQIACDVRDFTTQFATRFSDSAKSLDLKMMSYLSSLDKRKESLFIAGGTNNDDPMLDPKLPVKEMQQVLKDFGPEVAELRQKFKDAVAQASRPRSAFIIWLEKRLNLDKRRVTPDMVQNQIELARKQCLVSIIRICKRYPKLIVYVELEGLTDVDTSVRHYAIAAGLEGVGQLPRLIRLYEDSSLFNPDDVMARLNFNIFNIKQKWVEGNVA